MGTDKVEEVSYDNMDYGDEFNDDEEARYAKETYGGKKSAKNAEDDEENEEEGEEESSESQDVVPLAKDFSKRQNRGQRMTALVGKA